GCIRGYVGLGRGHEPDAAMDEVDPSGNADLPSPRREYTHAPIGRDHFRVDRQARTSLREGDELRSVATARRAGCCSNQGLDGAQQLRQVAIRAGDASLLDHTPDIAVEQMEDAIEQRAVERSTRDAVRLFDGRGEA